MKTQELIACKVSFNRPTTAGKELQYVSEAIENGHLCGDGAFTMRCQKLLQEQLGTPKVLLTTSCTHALEMAAILLDCRAGDEVIVPSFTFVSTINAFVLRGARPVFADIRPDTLNLDETQLERLITPRTKAIVPVHYAGVACEMDAIMAVANRHDIPVVEDNAHGLFATYKGKYTGTFGCLATQSFHDTKNFTCGEGGALLINSPELIERAIVIREKGTNRDRFFRGQIDKYTWVDIGSSYLPSEILAAFLLAQLEAKQQIQARRRAIWEFYYHNLSDWARTNGVGLPTVPANCTQSFHLFYLILPRYEQRQAFIAYLKERNISSAFHYVPLHLSDMGKPFGGYCPVTEDMSDRMVRLPFFNELSEAEQTYVVETVTRFQP